MTRTGAVHWTVSADRIVIAPCGARKLPRAALARDLYTGTYARHCIDYAIAMTRWDALDGYPLILSAKHGLVRIHDVLDPYDVTFGRPGAITIDALREQARHRGCLGCADVRVIGGARYVNIVMSVWPDAVPVIPPGLGMGEQMHWMISHPPHESPAALRALNGPLARTA